MLTGVIFVIIFLSILILVHELGHFLAAKKFGLLVEEFGFGLPPRIWGKKIGETIYSINALPFGGFVKIYGEDGASAITEDKKERSFTSLKSWQRAVILVAGVFFNFLLGWFVLSIIFSIGMPSAVVVTDVLKNTPAAEAGLVQGDMIKGFSTTEELIDFINNNRGKEIVLEVERNGETLKISAMPRINPPKGEGALGIGLVDAELQKQNIFVSFWEGLKASASLIITIFMAIIDLIGKAFVGRASLEAVTGPIGITKITAQASSMGFVYLLQLMALISLNLTVINIFPFPALDGGRLLFLGIEKIKGSPLDPKFEKIANTAGFALLILLMIAITIKDIIKL
ncbi:MAG: RIP metalloprotease RseP [Patescibacteria group bacterium]